MAKDEIVIAMRGNGNNRTHALVVGMFGFYL